MYDIRNQLKEFVEKHQNCCSNLIQHSEKYSYFKDAIMKHTCKFKDLPFSTRIYWYLNNISSYPRCANLECNKELRHDLKCKPLQGYVSKTCCKSCGQKTLLHKLKTQQTCLERYGNKCFQHSKHFKDKIKKTLSEKNEDFWKAAAEKRKNTCISKYNVSSVSKVKSIKEKATTSFMSRSAEEKQQSLDKSKATRLERYGNENYVNAEKISCTKNSFSAKKKQQILEKTRQTLASKYNCTNISQVKEVKDRIQNNRLITVRRNFYSTNIMNDSFIEPMFSCDYYVQHAKDQLEWKCKECGKIFKMKVGQHQPYIARCLSCHPLDAPTSNAEQELSNFLKSIIDDQIMLNTRDIISPYELDIYIPARRLAIEFDGMYWHSENLGTSRSYHLNKTCMCEKLGIQLIHVFELEWLLKKDIVKSRLKNLLGAYEKTLYARKCIVEECSSKESYSFLEANHIQGNANAAARICLKNDDEIVALMTFSKARYNKDKDMWELVRFCTKAGYHIPGAASKLLKAFELKFKPQQLVSYADRRWSIGNLYQKLGFKFDHASSPNYWYWNYKDNQLEVKSRLECQKHKISKFLKKFDQSKSEKQNMFDNGYFRIFDCGNLVYLKNYRSES